MTTKLNYEAKPPGHRGQRMRKLGVRCIVISACILLVSWGWRFYKQFQLVTRWQQWVSWTLPPAQVLFEWSKLKQGAYHGFVTIYQHEGRCPHQSAKGIDVVVGVGSYDAKDLADSLMLWARCATPPTLAIGSRSRLLSTTGLKLHADRLFAGQPDPADESHFTIGYELNRQLGIIDGWLMPDDTVKLEPRDGPLRIR